MKRKVYQEPTTKVVKLQHTQMLMTSGFSADRENYGKANSDVPVGEKNSTTGEWEWN